MKEKINVGFIGAGGFVSSQHLANCHLIPITRVYAIADLNEAVLADHRLVYQPEYTCTDYRKILADPEVDLVVIGTKQDMHAQMIIESLDSGKSVLCEKPMANTREETFAVLAAEKRNRGRLAIGFNRRFAPSYVKAMELLRNIPRPWFINYRLMNQSSHMLQDPFYATQPRIQYEGCHILDFACFLMGTPPSQVFMTGDKYANHCCIMSFSDGSQFQFLCGSIGSTTFWKENIEIFAADKTIAINDFTDMRIRGFKGETDLLFPPHRNEQKEAVLRYGLDFYELYNAAHCNDYIPEKYHVDWSKYHVANVMPVRPMPLQFNIDDFQPQDKSLRFFTADKGWYRSLEDFAHSLLTHSQACNASGIDGAVANLLADKLLESLEQNRPLPFNSSDLQQ